MHPNSGTEDLNSDRLRLVWMSPEFIRASLEGRLQDARRLLGADLPHDWPPDEAQDVLRLRLDQMTHRPDSGEWLLRAIVDRATNSLVGYINFHGPPTNGRAELGYTVLQAWRRRGYASEAALAMMAWADRQHSVDVFVVSISPENTPSLAMAGKLGFQRTGTQFDEQDGEEWVFELGWPRRKAGKPPT